MFLHGGEARLHAWKHFMTLFGDDPDLKNTFEFNDMTPHEMHENLWKRTKVTYEKHRDYFFKDS